MRKAFYLAAGLLVFHASKGQSSYREAHFTDSNRLEKIRATQPLVDRLYRDQAEKNHFPGLVYAVIADGQLAYSGSMGYTETEARTPTDTSSCFRIASMSKSFTALAILQLRDRGKLRLDDPARLYLPELKKLPYLTSDAPVITIRHLLTHDAGFPEDNPWGDRQLADTDSTLMALAAGFFFPIPRGGL